MSKPNNPASPGYYKIQQLAFMELERYINTNESSNIDYLIYDLSKRFPISQKAIEKRIYLFVRVNQDKFMILDGEVMHR